MSERQPLLQADNTHIEGTISPRPDIRNSPDNILVNVQNDEVEGETY